MAPNNSSSSGQNRIYQISFAKLSRRSAQGEERATNRERLRQEFGRGVHRECQTQ
jgi:hypothetical protein